MKQKLKTAEKGFSLLETLLVVSLLSGVMLVLTLFIQDYVRREQMRAVADYMQLVQRAVNEMVDTVAEFDAVYSLAASNGGAIEISILDPANPNRTVGYAPSPQISLERGTTLSTALSPSSIVHAGFDSGAAPDDSEFRDTLPIRASAAGYVTGIDGPSGNEFKNVRLTIVARIINASAERAMEFMVTTIDRLPESDIRDITGFMTANGGIISSRPDSQAANCPGGCALTARSAFGNWYARLSQFAGTRWHSIMNARRANEDIGGYLVSYTYLNEAMMAGDYLYRTAVPGNPELNRMYTPLDMGQNNIIGADNIEIGSATSSGNLYVSRDVHAQGSVSIGRDAAIAGDLVVDGNFQTGDLRVAPGINPSPTTSRGNIIIEGDLSAANLETSGDAYIAGDSNVSVLRANQLSGNNLRVLNELNVQRQEGIFAGSMNARNRTITVQGQTRAGEVTTPSVEAASIGVGRSMTMEGNLQVQNTATPVTVQNKVSTLGTVRIDNLTQCLSGC